MKKITTLEQLEYAKRDLFVKVVCPGCENVLTSTIPDAGEILRKEKCIICEVNFKKITNISERLASISLLEEAEVVSD